MSLLVTLLLGLVNAETVDFTNSCTGPGCGTLIEYPDWQGGDISVDIRGDFNGGNEQATTEVLHNDMVWSQGGCSGPTNQCTDAWASCGDWTNIPPGHVKVIVQTTAAVDFCATEFKWTISQNPGLAFIDGASCVWKDLDTDLLSLGNQYKGYTCPSGKIATGFRLKGYEENAQVHNDPIKVKCCDVAGHSEVTTDCNEIFATSQVSVGIVTADVVECSAENHYVLAGVYDIYDDEPWVYNQARVGKCCKVNCDAAYCEEGAWGVNHEQCTTVIADPEFVGEHDLACPTGTLLTRVIEGDAGPDQLGVQQVHSIECCELDIVAPPTRAPTMEPTLSPTDAPTMAPTLTPTDAPSPPPSPAPTTSEPTFAPSPAPTTGCTTCLLNVYNQQIAEEYEFLNKIDACLPECCTEEDVDHHETGGCQCDNFETPWNSCVSECPGWAPISYDTAPNGELCSICGLQSSTTSSQAMSVFSVPGTGSGVLIWALALIGGVSMVYTCTKTTMTKREYQHVFEHDV